MVWSKAKVYKVSHSNKCIIKTISHQHNSTNNLLISKVEMLVNCRIRLKTVSSRREWRIEVIWISSNRFNRQATHFSRKLYLMHRELKWNQVHKGISNSNRMVKTTIPQVHTWQAHVNQIKILSLKVELHNTISNQANSITSRIKEHLNNSHMGHLCAISNKMVPIIYSGK